MHADEFGVYSLMRIVEVDKETNTARYTVYNREHYFRPQYWGAYVPTLLSFEPTQLEARDARNLLHLLRRKLP